MSALAHGGARRTCSRTGRRAVGTGGKHGRFDRFGGSRCAGGGTHRRGEGRHGGKSRCRDQRQCRRHQGSRRCGGCGSDRRRRGRCVEAEGAGAGQPAGHTSGHAQRGRTGTAGRLQPEYRVFEGDFGPAGRVRRAYADQRQRLFRSADGKAGGLWRRRHG